MAEMESPRRFDRIFHPSDFTPTSDVAFAHALMIAWKGNASLQMMHVDTRDNADWGHFPNVPNTLERWNLIPAQDSDEPASSFGMEVTKVIAASQDPVQACLSFLELHSVDLIVLAVHQREGLMRWLGNPVGEKISAGANQSTLFIPVGQNGFVSLSDGSVQLRNILIPIVKKPRPAASIQFVQQLIDCMGGDSGTVTLLHVGSSDSLPFVQYPLEGAWTWKLLRIDGNRIDTILQVAEDTEADLIVMTTDGPDRFLDGLRGTTSERVLRKAKCPVAVIPVEPMIE